MKILLKKLNKKIRIQKTNFSLSEQHRVYIQNFFANILVVWTLCFILINFGSSHERPPSIYDKYAISLYILTIFSVIISHSVGKYFAKSTACDEVKRKIDDPTVSNEEIEELLVENFHISGKSIAKRFNRSS